MQQVIMYAQARPLEGEELPMPAPELFRMHIMRCFGDFPIELDKKDLDKLSGMASTWTDISANPYDTLIRAIKRLGAIKLWATYPENPTVQPSITESETSSPENSPTQ